MVDKFTDPLLTPKDVARHLRIPESTVYYWLREEANGAPLVHRVEPEKRGVDIFVHYAGDGQRPFRELIGDYSDHIEWDSKDRYASTPTSPP